MTPPDQLSGGKPSLLSQHLSVIFENVEKCLKMDRILEKLVEADGESVVGGVENQAGGAADLNLTSDDMNDVMKVLTSFEDYADAVSDETQA